jgi:hypothetical protein
VKSRLSLVPLASFWSAIPTSALLLLTAPTFQLTSRAAAVRQYSLHRPSSPDVSGGKAAPTRLMFVESLASRWFSHVMHRFI